MARIARIAPRDHIFHILTRGNNRQDVFRDGMDYQKYLEILDRYREKHQFKIYHYVMMRNHVHLALEPQEEGGSLAERVRFQKNLVVGSPLGMSSTGTMGESHSFFPSP